MQNASTYLVLGTCSLSVTVLAFVIYNAFGIAALKVVAPFAATLGLTFLAAHALDTIKEDEDAKAEATNAQSRRVPGDAPSAAAGAVVSGGVVGGSSSSTALPKRRRVAD